MIIRREIVPIGRKCGYCRKQIVKDEKCIAFGMTSFHEYCFFEMAFKGLGPKYFSDEIIAEIVAKQV